MNTLSIRKILKSDLPTLLAFRNNSSFMDFCTNRKQVVTLAEFENEILHDFSNDRQVQFLVLVGGIPIGTVWIYALNDQLNHAFISTFMADAWRNKGYGVYAHCRILQFMFEEVEIHTMYADVYIENSFSIRTMEKRGWQFEKKLTEKIIRYRGRFDDFKQNALPFASKCLYIK